MILAAPLCLPHIAERVRGKVGGLVFSGIGLGAVFSGYALPPLAEHDITAVWYLLGSLSLAAFLLSLFAFKPISKTTHKEEQSGRLDSKTSLFLWLLIASMC